VSSLLQKTRHENNFMREDANGALDSVVMSTPPSQVLGILTSYGIR
jgi:hypothetical protein